MASIILLWCSKHSAMAMAPKQEHRHDPYHETPIFQSIAARAPLMTT
jgi:hypothetical protein